MQIFWENWNLLLKKWKKDITAFNVIIDEFLYLKTKDKIRRNNEKYQEFI